jgi:hypothetical protein
MIIWMSLTKPSPNGRKLTAKFGAIVPKMIPMRSAKTSRPNRELANLSTVNLREAAPAAGRGSATLFRAILGS